MAAKSRKSSRRKSSGSKAGRGKSSRSPKASADGKKLVVVESPAKAKTINRYLGDDYVVKASMGHVRDLPRSKIGVEVEEDFAPTYELLDGRKKVVSELRKYARGAPEVYLATDLDREGEAIAWHLAETLNVPGDRIRRVVFNEITSGAIREAFSHPRGIDMDKVNAQQARRILDRLVGYRVSPLLWRKVATGLSAGRVQSVAVRLIVEREREIDAFTPEEYWKIAAILTPDLDAADRIADEYAALMSERDERGNPPTQARQQEFLTERNAFRAELVRWKGERFRADDSDTAIEIARAIGLRIGDDDVKVTEDPEAKGPAKRLVSVDGTVRPGSDGAAPPAYVVREIKQRESKSRPHPPFTTASMQQAASVQLRFSASRTMRIAQQLYEGVDVPGEGSVGLITYMRTDSRNLSNQAIGQVRELIGGDFGDRYLPEKPNRYTSGQRAQEAHEAVRPTDPRRRPDDLRRALSEEQFKLYELIWKRFVACQMPPAVWKVTEADIAVDTDAGEARLKAMGRRLAFDGFLRVAGMPRSGEQILPELAAKQELAPVSIEPTQHLTQPPPRYTEASLVKALEADGIGRPSTYASIIQTIQDRKYVEQINRVFHPTDLGVVVTDKLVAHFPNVFDVRFTAHMEEELDKVEEAEEDWVRLLREFYGPFAETLEKASEEMVHAKAETQPSEYTCEKCGREMVYRFSSNGRYLACTGYPECKQTYPVDRKGAKIEKKPVDVACPKCGGEMLLRRGRYGPFLSCARYPDCDGVVNLDRKGAIKPPSPPPLEVDLECPKCGSPLNLRRGKRGPWLGCSAYPKCRGRLGWTKLDEDKRAELEKQLEQHEVANPQPVIRHLDGTPVPDGYKPDAPPEADNDGDEGSSGE